MDALERVPQRSADEDDRTVRERVRNLCELLVAGSHRPTHRLRVRLECLHHQRVVLDVGGRNRIRVVEDRQDRPTKVLGGEVDDPSVGLGRSTRDSRMELVFRAVAKRRPNPPHVVAQLIQLRVDQVALERRHDDQVREQQCARNDEGQGEGEPPADAPQRVHRSRNR